MNYFHYISTDNKMVVIYISNAKHLKINNLEKLFNYI